MFGDLQKMFTRFLHLTDPWKVTSVTVNDAETRVDIIVVCDGKPRVLCPNCGCGCGGYDKMDRTWRHTDLFDMECHLHCTVDRMQCPKCGKVIIADVPWAEKDSGFTLLYDTVS